MNHADRRHQTLGDPRAVRTLLDMMRTDGSGSRALTVMATAPAPTTTRQPPAPIHLERTPAAIRALRDEGIIGVLAGRR